MTIPFVVKVTLAATIAVSVSAAAAARPPKSVRPGLTGIILGGSVVLYAVAAAFFSQGKGNVAAVMLVIASEGMCVAAWLGRAIVGGGEGRRPIEPDPGGGGEKDLVDWSAFENFRRSWSRERAGRGSGGDDSA